MLVSTAHRKLVLNLRSPERVTTVIPSAKVFDYKGSPLVAVPHGLDEVRVLRNLGFDETPSPILYHYNWPGRFTPFFAQRATAEFLTLNPKAFVLNDMGTGKTLATLWAFHYLRSIGVARRLMIVAPLSTLERVWADEVFQHFPDLTVGIMHGTKERRLKILAGGYDVLVINHDGVGVIQKELMADTEIDTVVVDELASFRNASTNRWKALNKVCLERPRVWGLTGSPTPNSPTDAWAQAKLISPERIPKYFNAARDALMSSVSQFRFLARPTATETVAQWLQPAIRFSRDQCVDLPPAIYLDREVAMTQDQKVAYRDMLGKLKMEFKSQQVTAINEGVKRLKLLQIASGVVYGADGNEVVIPSQPRIDAVRELIDEAGGKIIVFVPFKSVLRYVAEELGKHYGVAVISGDVSASKRATIFQEFQSNAHPRIICAIPSAMSHGLTLTAANTVIWWGPTDNNETYEQANARVTRPGQKLTQFVAHIMSTPVERKVYNSLKVKGSMQGILLDAIREEG